MNQKLPREFYTRTDTIQIAKDLLGKVLVVPTDSGERVSGIIVETEAYLGAEDKAAHSHIEVACCLRRRLPNDECSRGRFRGLCERILIVSTIMRER